MKRATAGLIWLGLLLGGSALALVGIFIMVRFGGYGWKTTLFGRTVDPATPGLLITLLGLAAILGTWLLDQRWRKINLP